MGAMHFQVPGNLPAEIAEKLRRAYLAGGYDRSPVQTRVDSSGDRLTLRRDNDESGYVVAPWEIAGAGLLMGQSSTLMERASPYRLLVELARGKVNQIRSQAFEWRLGGLEILPAVEERIRTATMAFGKAVLEPNPADAERYAVAALEEAYGTAEALVALYVEQISSFRRQQQERIDSSLACRLNEVPSGEIEDAYRQTFNAVGVPLTWRSTEPQEANYNWEAADRVVDWALDQKMGIVAGPLIDFSTFGVPTWLHDWEGDLPSLASFMCDYIETVVARYRDRIRRWVICTGSNGTRALGLSEDDLIRLTARLSEAAWGIDPNLEVVVGLSQPWGEYLAGDSFNYSPFVFADTLLRAGLPFAGFELEWHMGTSPRGSFCRDPLEASRLLDMFGLLGCPIQLALSYPSSTDRDLRADAEQSTGKAGYWHGVTTLAQAEWAETFTSLALAKGFVVGAFWDHLNDGLPHHFPNAGLVDAMGHRKPSFDRLRLLRETHFRRPGGTFIA